MMKLKQHIIRSIATLPQLAGLFFLGSALAQPTVPPSKVGDAAAALQGPDFDVAVKATQTQSQAVVRAAAQSAAGLQPNYAHDLLQSEGFDKEVQRQGNHNPTVVSFVTPDIITRARGMLPKPSQLISGLKYGKHIVVSQNGEEIITLIRTLATSSLTEQPALLRKLQGFSARGAPEAMNFMGFVLEHGLFNARPDMQHALAYYKSAAAARYQPALYNLALAAAYGRDASVGQTQAMTLISKAAALGEESSSRVCGLGSFLGFRRNDKVAAVKFSKNCFSPLANLSKASFNADLTVPERVKLLRDSLATGADDAYVVIERVTRTEAMTDKNFTYCKYKLVNHYRKTKQFNDLRNAAGHCYQQFTKDTGNSFNNKQMRKQAIAGISVFVPAEIDSLKQRRLSNHFHYAWSAPYLPFTQMDVDLFTPLLSRAKP